MPVGEADGSLRISERPLGGFNGNVRHQHGDQIFPPALLTHPVTTAPNYCSESDRSKEELLGARWIIA